MRIVFLFFVFISAVCQGQNSFSEAFHFEDNASHEGKEIELVDGKIVLLTSEICQIPNDENCFRLLKSDIDFQFWEENKLVVGPANYNRGFRNVFCPSTKGGFYLGSHISLNWTLWRIDENLDTLWRVSYPETQIDFLKSILETSDGGIILCGAVSPDVDEPQMALRKVDSLGNTIWFNKYPLSLWDELFSVVEDHDGGFICGGRVNNYELEGDNNGYILKVNSEGEKVWDMIVPGLEIPEGETFPFLDTPIYLQTYPDGGYVYYQGMANDFPWTVPVFVARIVKVDSQFETEWEVRFDEGSFEHFIRTLVISEDGSLIACGTDLNGPNPGADNGFICKVSPEGELLWKRTYVHPTDWEPEKSRMWLNDLVELPGGDIIATGSALTTEMQFLDLWLLRVDKDGCLTPGCDEDIVYVDMQDVGISVSNSRELFFKASPNPVHDQVQLTFYNEWQRGNGELQLVDFKGNILLKRNVLSGTNSLKLDLSKFPFGLYFLRLNDANQELQSEKIFIFK